jgi:hypothetical protein
VSGLLLDYYCIGTMHGVDERRMVIWYQESWAWAYCGGSAAKILKEMKLE